MKMLSTDLISFLNDKVAQYNQVNFIPNDPISIPHRYTLKEDIEIAGFLSSVIAWGRRDLILAKANLWMELMDDSPYDFLMNASDDDMYVFERFYYRTFSSADCLYFIKALRSIYQECGGLEAVFNQGYALGGVREALILFRSVFLSFNPPDRTQKHVANVLKGSSAKRLNMFLRWMVRFDDRGVDFGLWKSIQASDLYLPLDLHTGNVSRKIGLLTRTQNDWKAVDELTRNLRLLDPSDPVKYDYALFSLGVNEHF